jgi:hypothetical protein
MHAQLKAERGITSTGENANAYGVKRKTYSYQTGGSLAKRITLEGLTNLKISDHHHDL